MAGLDAINNAEVGSDAAESNAVQGAAQTYTADALPTGKGKTNLNLGPQETRELLKSMQAMIDERTGGWQGFMSGLQDAAAWATPGITGQKALALQSRNQEKRAEAQDIAGMRAQMAQLQATDQSNQARSANMAGTLKQLRGGETGGMPSGLDANVLNRVEELYSVGQRDAGDKLLNTHLEEMAKINRTARTGDTYYKKTIEVVDPNNPNGVIYVSPSDIDSMNLKPTAKGRAQLQVASETPTAGGGDMFGSIVNNLIDKREGGYKATDGNTGAPVNFGINQKYNSDIDVKNLTKEDAKKIYLERYWNPIGADKLNPDAAAVAFDAAVNQGVDYAKKLIKQANGDAQAMMDIRRADYAKGTSNPGWENRLNSLEKELSYKQPTQQQQQRPNIGAPITSETRAGVASQEAGAKEYATQVSKAHATAAAGVDESYNTSGDRLNRNRSSIALLDDPDVKKMVGYLDKPGAGAAILRQIQDGITFGRLGDINLKDFGTNLAKVGASQAEIDKFNKLISNLQNDEAQQARAEFKGQGAVSDMERKLISNIVGSVKTSAEAVKTAVQWRLERAQFDKEMGEAFNKYRDDYGDTASFGKFMRTEGKRIIAAHNDRLATMLNIDRSQLEGNRGYESGPAPKESGSAKPSSADDLVNKYKTKK